MLVDRGKREKTLQKVINYKSRALLSPSELELDNKMLRSLISLFFSSYDYNLYFNIHKSS